MSDHSDSAQTLIEKIRALSEDIPHFALPGTAGRRPLVSAATLPPDFILLAAASAENDPVLARPNAASPDQMRDWLDFAKAYDVVAEEFENMAKFVRHSTALARNKAGREALNIYALASRLGRQPENAQLFLIAEALRQALGNRARKSKKAKAAVPKSEE
jgi:hypothetical protein